MTDMTTPPQPPKLTIVPPPAPAVLSWNHNPPPPARYIYGRIIAVCVDCGEDGGCEDAARTAATASVWRLRLGVATGSAISNDPDLPITDEPRCAACTALAAYRALPWWQHQKAATMTPRRSSAAHRLSLIHI